MTMPVQPRAILRYCFLPSAMCPCQHPNQPPPTRALYFLHSTLDSPLPFYPITRRGVAFIRYLWHTACIWLAAACRSTTQPEYPNQISISKVVSFHLQAPSPLWSVSIISSKCPIRNPLRQQVEHKGNSQISCYKSSNLAVRALGIQYTYTMYKLTTL